MKPTLEQTIIEATRHAGEMIRDNAFDYGEHEWKKKDDPVTNLDKEAEWEIKNEIQMRMDANFIGEEQGYEDNGAKVTFIIDPIDGTKSFMRGNFLSAVSVAAEEDGKLVAAAVYDFMRDIMYVGYRGETYMLHQGRKVPEREQARFSKIRVAFKQNGSEMTGRFHAHPEINPAECDGSIALGLAQLAAGNYDGFIACERGKSNIWDIAAGVYLAECRGLQIRDLDDKEFDHKNPGNGLVVLNSYAIPHKGEILERVNGCYRSS